MCYHARAHVRAGFNVQFLICATSSIYLSQNTSQIKIFCMDHFKKKGEGGRVGRFYDVQFLHLRNLGNLLGRNTGGCDLLQGEHIDQLGLQTHT